MQAGVCHTVRDFRDGRTLASPGRWPPAVRRYARSYKAVLVLVKRFSEHFGTTELLMDLVLGRVKECPFPSGAVSETQGRSRERAVFTGSPAESGRW